VARGILPAATAFGVRGGLLLAHVRFRLANGDWSCFSPAEQASFALARKLTFTAGDSKSADLDRLRRQRGDASAFYTHWQLCHSLYMMRISDGFQFTLERESVFHPYFLSHNQRQ